MQFHFNFFIIISSSVVDTVVTAVGLAIEDVIDFSDNFVFNIIY